MKNKEIFSTYANRSYDLITSQLSYYKKLQNDAVRNLNQCNSVVDIGTGTGNLAIALTRAGKKVLAIDNNPMMIQKAKQKVFSEGLTGMIEIIEHDIDIKDRQGYEKLQGLIGRGNFDGAASLNVLYCLENPYNIIDIVNESLKLGGIFVLSGPKPDTDVEVIRKQMEIDLANERERLKDDLEIWTEIQLLLKNNMKNFYSTDRIEEILIKYSGFSDVVERDIDFFNPTYLGQGFFISVRKNTDYKDLKISDINMREAKKSEMEKIFRFRYHIMNERLKVLEASEEHQKSMMEFDEYDNNSTYFVAEHNGKYLAIVRAVRDSGILKLPIDQFSPLDQLREKGQIICEPGRWLKIPSAPRGLGREIWKYAHIKTAEMGVDTWAVMLEGDNYNMCRKMGYKMDNLTESSVKGINRQGYIEIYSRSDPPKFLKDHLR